MEPLSIIALVFACVAGWIIVSIAAAFVFARLIGRADDERRSRRVRRSPGLTRSGVEHGSAPPERATMR